MGCSVCSEQAVGLLAVGESTDLLAFLQGCDLDILETRGFRSPLSPPLVHWQLSSCHLHSLLCSSNMVLNIGDIPSLGHLVPVSQHQPCQTTALFPGLTIQPSTVHPNPSESFHYPSLVFLVTPFTNLQALPQNILHL